MLLKQYSFIILTIIRAISETGFNAGTIAAIVNVVEIVFTITPPTEKNVTHIYWLIDITNIKSNILPKWN